MIVVDASIAIKMLAREAGSDRAFARLADEAARVAPDFCTIEVAAALAKKVRGGALSPDRAVVALGALPMIVTSTYDTHALIGSAMQLSASIDHALYDCIYLALAIELDGVVVTSDQKFARSADRGGLGSSVELLIA